MDNPAPTSKREAIAKAVEAIVEKLHERHGDTGFSVDQFCRWAHMINSGKWSSHDDPLDFPFLKETKCQEKQDNRSDDECCTSSRFTVVVGSPFTKRMKRCAQCIDRLSNWHVLESGGITQAQYNEFKVSLFDDMKQE